MWNVVLIMGYSQKRQRALVWMDISAVPLGSAFASCLRLRTLWPTLLSWALMRSAGRQGLEKAGLLGGVNPSPLESPAPHALSNNSIPSTGARQEARRLRWGCPWPHPSSRMLTVVSCTRRVVSVCEGSGHPPWPPTMWRLVTSRLLWFMEATPRTWAVPPSFMLQVALVFVIAHMPSHWVMSLGSRGQPGA